MVDGSSKSIAMESISSSSRSLGKAPSADTGGRRSVSTFAKLLYSDTNKLCLSRKVNKQQGLEIIRRHDATHKFVFTAPVEDIHLLIFLIHAKAYMICNASTHLVEGGDCVF